MAMNPMGGIDQQINDRMDTYAGDPGKAQERAKLTGGMVDLIASKQLLEQAKASQRNKVLQTMGQQGGTIADRVNGELASLIGAASPNPAMQAADRMQNIIPQMQRAQQQRPPTQPLPPTPSASPRMAAGGIVAFQEGGDTDKKAPELSEGERQALLQKYLVLNEAEQQEAQNKIARTEGPTVSGSVAAGAGGIGQWAKENPDEAIALGLMAIPGLGAGYNMAKAPITAAAKYGLKRYGHKIPTWARGIIPGPAQTAQLAGKELLKNPQAIGTAYLGGKAVLGDGEATPTGIQTVAPEQPAPTTTTTPPPGPVKDTRVAEVDSVLAELGLDDAGTAEAPAGQKESAAQEAATNPGTSDRVDILGELESWRGEADSVTDAMETAREGDEKALKVYEKFLQENIRLEREATKGLQERLEARVKSDRWDNLIARMVAFGGAETFAQGATRSGVIGAADKQLRQRYQDVMYKDVYNAKKAIRDQEVANAKDLFAKNAALRNRAVEIANVRFNQGVELAKLGDTLMKTQVLADTLAETIRDNKARLQEMARSNREKERIDRATTKIAAENAKTQAYLADIQVARLAQAIGMDKAKIVMDSFGNELKAAEALALTDPEAAAARMEDTTKRLGEFVKSLLATE